MPKVAFSEEEVGIVERGNVHFFQAFRVKSIFDVFSGHLSDEARFGPGVRNRAKGAHFLLRSPRLNPSSISSLRSSVGSLQCLEHSTLFHSPSSCVAGFPCSCTGGVPTRPAPCPRSLGLAARCRGPRSVADRRGGAAALFSFVGGRWLRELLSVALFHRGSRNGNRFVFVKLFNCSAMN